MTKYTAMIVKNLVTRKAAAKRELLFNEPASVLFRGRFVEDVKSCFLSQTKLSSNFWMSSLIECEPPLNLAWAKLDMKL